MFTSELAVPELSTGQKLPSSLSAKGYATPSVLPLMRTSSALLCCFGFVALMPARAESPALTIYNQGFAVVRDTLPIDLKPGLNNVTFSGATAKLEPDSVILRDSAGQAALQILEQNYRNDPISEPLLLSLFEGKTLEFQRRLSGKPDELVQGKVVRSGYTPGGQNTQPIIEVDGKLQFSLPGQPLFPSLGGDSILKPTLNWQLNAAAPAKIQAEVAYVTQGFSWQASYNLVAPQKGDLIDFVGWITMKNDSGTAFNEARIKLMAGDVNKVQPEEQVNGLMRRVAGFAGGRADAPVVTEKAFDEFHLYSLAHPATLHDKETKQVEFVRATGVKAERLYIYDGAQLGGWRVGMSVGSNQSYGVRSNTKVAVYRQFKNEEANHLGLPLPKGRVRFYSQDDDRQLEFVGENEIDHTPRGELVRLYIGNSFDLVGERKRTDFKTNEANKWSEESFEIKVRNRKKEAAEIRVIEHLYRWNNWSILEKTQDYVKTDAQTVEFHVPLQPDEEKTINYKVHYNW